MTLPVSAIVVTYRSRLYIDQCLTSLTNEGVRHIWVVDNASDDNTADYVADHYPDVHLIRNTANVGFAAANNQALRQTTTTFVLLLNPDAWLEPGAVHNMLKCMADDVTTGAVGPRIMRGEMVEPSLLDDPTFPRALMFILSGMRAYETGGFSGRISPGCPWDNGGEGDHVRGSCMLVRTQAVKDAGLLDERFFLYFEETEWCLRMRLAGWQVRVTPVAVANHIGKASVLTEEQLPSVEYMRSAVLFWQKHYGPLRSDILRMALLAMATMKCLALMVWHRSPDKQVWLRNVMRLARDPFIVPIPYPGARRPSCWTEIEKP